MANCRCIVVPDLDTAVAVSNEYAPEHLIIQTREPRALLPQVELRRLGVPRRVVAGIHGRLLLGHQPRAADLRLRAQLQRPVAARLPEAHHRAGTDAPTDCARSAPPRSRSSDLEGLDAHGNAVTGAPRRAGGRRRMSDILALARPGHRRAQGLLARELGPGVRPPARQRTAVARRDRSLAGRPQSLSRSRSRTSSRQRLAAAVRRARRSSCCRAAAATKPSTSWCAPSAAPGVDNVIICPPTFGMYAVAARIQGAEVREVPLLRAARLRARCRRRARRLRRATRSIVFLCSPNNPTGNALDPARRSSSCWRRSPARALVVVDEAYIEFSGAPVAGRLAGAIPEPRRAAHAVEGLRPRRRARRFADRAAPEIIALLRAR